MGLLQKFRGLFEGLSSSWAGRGLLQVGHTRSLALTWVAQFGQMNVRSLIAFLSNIISGDSVAGSSDFNPAPQASQNAESEKFSSRHFGQGFILPAEDSPLFTKAK